MQRQPVSSSNLASIGYDPDSQVLEVEFLNGGLYQYFGVPQGLYDELMAAGSHGSFFSQHIRNQFQFERL
jgi:hypothetical protein